MPGASYRSIASVVINGVLDPSLSAMSPVTLCRALTQIWTFRREQVHIGVGYLVDIFNLNSVLLL